ncbi:MarR family winged helix-turn-helix transcriptional regulator [Secundilactobacillus mixtipabuli]|uniref:MarR family transcriptional regulator n=1 Tax=Secundilactobacillus mixtipabuli TaxID=1435342 RepID=A0A1Z5IDQ5_9LACO|nr:MarR family transcriptional regulator [Secundilactobacillus mixtipabuli]GAW99899.1 MarR family transcriptional regulator [Secundilactobacillus mixtipabuli]
MAAKRFDLNSCMMFITTRSSKLFATKFNQALKTENIARSEWMSLFYIDQHQPLTQRQLSDLVGITGPSMVKVINKLVTRELIISEQSRTDKRERLISLTADGERLLKETLPIASQFQDAVTDGISQRDLDKVADVMDKMVENASKL